MSATLRSRAAGHLAATADAPAGAPADACADALSAASIGAGRARQPARHGALLAAALALTGLHAPALATPDLPIVIQTCPKEGRDPSAALIQHSCGVWSPDDFAASPSWTRLELLARDGSSTGGRVVAELLCMRRGTGELTRVARVQSPASPAPVRSPLLASTVLPAPLSFSECGYLIRVTVDGVDTGASALMATLRSR